MDLNHNLFRLRAYADDVNAFGKADFAAVIFGYVSYQSAIDSINRYRHILNAFYSDTFCRNPDFAFLSYGYVVNA